MIGTWWGWYAQQDACEHRPSSMRWTKGAEGDSFRECLSRLESAAPRGRVLVVLRSGALPGRVLRKGQSASKPPRRGRPKTWEAKIPLILAQIDGDWKTAREIQDGVGLRSPEANIDLRLFAVLREQIEAGTVEARTRKKTPYHAAPPGSSMRLLNMDGPAREYRRVGT